MSNLVSYVFIFIIAVVIIKWISNFLSRHRRNWQSCAKKYRFAFTVGQEEKDGQSVRAFRLKGYYRTCLVTLYSSRAETIITVNYPKNLLDNLSVYPEGLLGRIGRGLTRQLSSQSRAGHPFFVVPSATSDSAAPEAKREFNPLLREQLIQLMIICGAKDKRLELTDAYLMNKQPGFTGNPVKLFPLVDEIISFINLLEANVTDLLL